MFSFPIRAIQVLLLIQHEDNASIKYELLEGLGVRTACSHYPWVRVAQGQLLKK